MFINEEANKSYVKAPEGQKLGTRVICESSACPLWRPFVTIEYMQIDLP